MRSDVARPGEHLDRQRRPNAAHRNQFLEDDLLVGGKKTEQREGILPNVRVDSQLNFGADIRESGKSGDGNQNIVAHAAGLEDDLVGVLFEKLAVKEGNHRPRALTKSSRPAMTLKNSSISSGLVIKRAAPSWVALSRSRGEDELVKITTGMSRRRLSFLRCSRTCSPLIPGKFQSNKTKSGRMSR